MPRFRVLHMRAGRYVSARCSKQQNMGENRHRADSTRPANFLAHLHAGAGVGSPPRALEAEHLELAVVLVRVGRLPRKQGRRGLRGRAS